MQISKFARPWIFFERVFNPKRYNFKTIYSISDAIFSFFLHFIFFPTSSYYIYSLSTSIPPPYHNKPLKICNTICPRSIDPYYIVSFNGSLLLGHIILVMNRPGLNRIQRCERSVFLRRLNAWQPCRSGDLECTYF